MGHANCLFNILATVLLMIFPVHLCHSESGYFRRQSTSSYSTHPVVLNDVSVFTTERLQVRFDISFQYVLSAEDLGLLQQHNVSYDSIIKASAVDAVKMQMFGIRQFFSEPEVVQAGLLEAVTERLGCCAAVCETYQFVCIPGCHSGLLCISRAIQVRVQNFQLTDIQIPEFIRNMLQADFRSAK